MRLGVFGAGVVVAAIAIVTNVSSTPAAASAPGGANVWVDTNGGSCSRSGTRTAYADSRACSSFDAALRAASSGDKVGIAGGSYGDQVIRSSSGSKTVTFQGGSQSVVLNTLDVEASNVTIANVAVSRSSPSGPEFALSDGGNHNTFTSVDVNAGHLTDHGGIFVGGQYGTFRNGSVHNTLDDKGVLSDKGDHASFDHWDFYDVHASSSSVHAECFYNESNYLSITNSQFWNCYTMDINYTTCCGNPPAGTGMTLRNNVFQSPINSDPEGPRLSGYAVNFNSSTIGTLTNWTVVNNTFAGQVSNSGNVSGFVWANNIGGSWGCLSGATYANNVGKRCGSSDRATRSFGFVNDPSGPGRGDYHLAGRSAAIGAGAANYAPDTDKDGVNRPKKGQIEAGAYQSSVGILAAAGLGADAATARRVSRQIQAFQDANAANLFVALGNNDYTHGHGFAQAWRANFGWLANARVGVAGVLGNADVAEGRGGYQLQPLGMPARYFVRYVRGAQVIALDSNSVTDAQTAWLARTLAAPDTGFRIVVLNGSPYSCGAGQGVEAVRARWVPLFERYKVDLVLGANDSSYQRFAGGGVTYVVAGGKAKAGRTRSRCPGSFPRRRAVRKPPAFLYLEVTANALTVRAVGASGATADRFTLK